MGLSLNHETQSSVLCKKKKVYNEKVLFTLQPHIQFFVLSWLFWIDERISWNMKCKKKKKNTLNPIFARQRWFRWHSNPIFKCRISVACCVTAAWQATTDVIKMATHSNCRNTWRFASVFCVAAFFWRDGRVQNHDLKLQVIERWDVLDPLPFHCFFFL